MTNYPAIPCCAAYFVIVALCLSSSFKYNDCFLLEFSIATTYKTSSLAALMTPLSNSLLNDPEGAGSSISTASSLNYSHSAILYKLID